MSYSSQTPAPSKVLHIRNANSEPREVDLNIILPYLSTFGTCVYVVTMPKLQQAIVEMDSIESAQKAFEVARGNLLDLRDQKFYIHYSKSATINREPSFRRTLVEHKGERILLATVHNPLYPITMEIVVTIMKDYKPLRIVIFHATGVQFLVEFSTPEDAKAAKDALDGREIYSGCCLLKVVYSKEQDCLKVRENNERTWDFTMGEFPMH